MHANQGASTSLDTRSGRMQNIPSLQLQLKDVPWEHQNTPGHKSCNSPVQQVEPMGVTPSSVIEMCKKHGWPERSQPARVFDLFMMATEVDVVEARLYELNSTVDVFVIAEANVTHKHGIYKPSMFRRHLERFAPFANKIVHVWAQLHCPGLFWICESYQRDLLLDGFVRAGGREHDVVIVSDADEIPRASTVAAMRACNFDGSGNVRGRLLQLLASHYLYSAHCLRVDQQWRLGPRAAHGRIALRHGTAQLRGPYESAYSRSMGPTDKAKHRYFSDTQPFMPYQHTRMQLCSSALGEKRRSRKRKSATHPCPTETPASGTPDMVEEHAVADAAWHFSYFGSPEEIRAKYYSTLVGAGEERTPSYYYKLAMRCSAPQHPKWRFPYVKQVTEYHVPRFVLANKCRMRRFFWYDRAHIMPVYDI